ncbi:MAG: 23S rRNA (pseudouridine(1915)-N(3))-methyltransferase RlmH [Alphaproteobacteria bacterium]|nr:23S rRNA (pseudouridine(1915)-N(3))-methyltransferase RlmH [Alphaproteobacteria bacterium]MBL6954301.1 23S rRNA (pseudouridine(1915)-N(3))-methyltransferase RlmH [Alphaproteobacteria bacterium]
MRISICAVGRARGNPAAEICQTYLQRLPWPVEIHEVEVRKNLTGEKLAMGEAELLRAAMPAQAIVVALDGKGKAFSSEAFAQRLGRWRDDGVADLAFAIGGANGLHPDLPRAADLVLSLGAMTWPHLLARAMLVEQLYRAHTILAGHPYHRA